MCVCVDLIHMQRKGMIQTRTSSKRNLIELSCTKSSLKVTVDWVLSRPRFLGCSTKPHGIEHSDSTMKRHIFYKSRGVTCGGNVQSSPDGMNIGSCGTKVFSKTAIPTTVNAGAVLASWSILYGLVLDLAGRSF